MTEAPMSTSIVAVLAISLAAASPVWGQMKMKPMQPMQPMGTMMAPKDAPEA